MCNIISRSLLTFTSQISAISERAAKTSINRFDLGDLRDYFILSSKSNLCNKQTGTKFQSESISLIGDLLTRIKTIKNRAMEIWVYLALVRSNEQLIRYKGIVLTFMMRVRSRLV